MQEITDAGVLTIALAEALQCADDEAPTDGEERQIARIMPTIDCEGMTITLRTGETYSVTVRRVCP